MTTRDTDAEGPTINIIGGQIVSSSGVFFADLEIEAGRVRRLITPGSSIASADDTIDASGCYVLPGGVDPHTHLLSGIRAATSAAAVGGTTTALAFTAPQAHESAVDAFQRAREDLIGQTTVDVGLHAAVWQPDQLTREQMVELRALGVSGVKLYLAYSELGMLTSDRRLFELMVTARRVGLRIQVHCENDGLISGLAAQHATAGLSDPKHFAASRPRQAEEEAINRALSIAAVVKVPLYVAHVTTGGGLRLIQKARDGGQVVWAEACLPHLFLTSERYEQADAERFLLAPPLRGPEEVEALWVGLRDHVVNSIGTDHSQTRFRSRSGPFGGLAYGLAGVEVRIALLLSAGCKRNIPLERLVEVLAEGPAKAFGHYPKKGVLAPGSDADVIVWDPRARWTIESDVLNDPSVDCPYLGFAVEGRVRDVLLRGTVLVRGTASALEHSGGQYLAALQAAPSSGGAVC